VPVRCVQSPAIIRIDRAIRPQSISTPALSCQCPALLRRRNATFCQRTCRLLLRPVQMQLTAVCARSVLSCPVLCCDWRAVPCPLPPLWPVDRALESVRSLISSLSVRLQALPPNSVGPAADISAELSTVLDAVNQAINDPATVRIHNPHTHSDGMQTLCANGLRPTLLCDSLPIVRACACAFVRLCRARPNAISTVLFARK
jgi:hypothetical protein